MHKLVTLRPNPIVSRHHVNAWVLVVVIVNTLTPVLGGVAFLIEAPRICLACLPEAWPLRARGKFGRNQVLYQVCVATAGFCYAGPFYDEGHLKGFVVHPTLVVPSVVPDVETLIRAIDYDGIFIQAQLLQCLLEVIHAFVHALDAP